MDIMHHMLYYEFNALYTQSYNIISLDHEVNMQRINVTVSRQIFKITAYLLKIIYYVYKTPHTSIEWMQTLKFKNVYMHVQYILSKFINNDLYTISTAIIMLRYEFDYTF